VLLKKFISNKVGSGAGAVLLSAAIILTAFLAFVTAVDYGMYSMKYRILVRGIDYASAAAVQEIDADKSKEGLSGGFDEELGTISANSIFFDNEKANRIFFTTFSANTGVDGSELKKHLLTAFVSPLENGLECTFYKEAYSERILIANTGMLEGAVNDTINKLFSSDEASEEKKIIYINGNIKTNEFKKRPHFIVFIRGYNINGLFRNRKADFACFAGARVERGNVRK
jgi:cytolysin (calcineurin-like family phosphatase)